MWLILAFTDHPQLIVILNITWKILLGIDSVHQYRRRSGDSNVAIEDRTWGGQSSSETFHQLATPHTGDIECWLKCPWRLLTCRKVESRSLLPSRMVIVSKFLFTDPCTVMWCIFIPNIRGMGAADRWSLVVGPWWWKQPGMGVASVVCIPHHWRFCPGQIAGHRSCWIHWRMHTTPSLRSRWSTLLVCLQAR